MKVAKTKQLPFGAVIPSAGKPTRRSLLLRWRVGPAGSRHRSDQLVPPRATPQLGEPAVFALTGNVRRYSSRRKKFVADRLDQSLALNSKWCFRTTAAILASSSSTV